MLHCCECEPVTVTMVRARLWPATPRFPRLAFSFDLLDWVEALLLECQVAVRDFCGALFFKCPYIIQEVCTMCLVREYDSIVLHMLGCREETSTLQ